MKDTKTLYMISQRIREARVAAGLSQATLAEQIGVSDKSISSYEKGRALPPFDKLRKIAQYTNRPLPYFTEEQTQASVIAEKLTRVEKELAEIKSLLKKQG